MWNTDASSRAILFFMFVYLLCLLLLMHVQYVHASVHVDCVCMSLRGTTDEVRTYVSSNTSRRLCRKSWYASRTRINTAHEEESWARSPRAGAAKAGMASRTRINCRKAGLARLGLCRKRWRLIKRHASGGTSPSGSAPRGTDQHSGVSTVRWRGPHAHGSTQRRAGS